MPLTMKTYSTKEVAEMLGLTYPHFRALLAAGEAPRPENRAGNSFVWLDADIKKIRKWLASRPERRGRPRKDD